MAVPLHAGGAGAWFQLEPAVCSSHGHLLWGTAVRPRGPPHTLPHRPVEPWEDAGGLRGAQGQEPLQAAPPRSPRRVGGPQGSKVMATASAPMHVAGVPRRGVIILLLSPHTRTGMLRHPRKSSVWSSVGPAVPFARADLTICLKYLGTTRWAQASGPELLPTGSWALGPTCDLGCKVPHPIPAHALQTDYFIQLPACFCQGHVVIVVPGGGHGLPGAPSPG